MAAASGAETTLTTAWFESIEKPMLLCDRSLVVLAANRAAAGLLEVPTSELLHRKLDEVLTPAASLGPLPIPPQPGRLQWRCEFQPAKGDRRSLEISGTRLLDQATGAEGWVLSLRGSKLVAAVPEFIGRSAIARELMEFVARLAATRVNSILVIGDSGTGKELIAKRLHLLGPRAAAPLIPINCAALPETLLESELFGHEKGAFTGAQQQKEGLLEVADGGTVLLDEIGELPVGLQAKLLRVLEERTFRRIGGARDISVDVRIVAATNADLEKAIAEGRFRSDLYHRLNGVQIRVPSLRERMEDLPDLTAFFIDHFNRVHDRHILGIHPVARLLLERYDWPGNVRELRNAIERAVLVETSPLLTTASLALQNGVDARPRTSAAPDEIHPPARYCLHNGERELIAAALAETGGNQSRAAELLGIGRFGLRYKMKKFGMLRAG